MPDRVSPQLATLVSVPPTGKGWAYEIKFDGYRVLARCEAGKVTRNENDWTAKMQSVAREVAALPVQTAWLDGEVVVLGDDGLPKFNALQNAFDDARRKHSAPYLSWNAAGQAGEVSAPRMTN
jgi:bifunctional non-homologous end joining protein LigD